MQQRPSIFRATDQTSSVLRFYSYRTNKEMTAWEKQLQRTNFKASKSTKVYSNHFAGGYRSDPCKVPILCMKGYPDEGNDLKARENIDTKAAFQARFRAFSEAMR